MNTTPKPKRKPIKFSGAAKVTLTALSVTGFIGGWDMIAHVANKKVQAQAPQSVSPAVALPAPTSTPTPWPTLAPLPTLPPLPTLAVNNLAAQPTLVPQKIEAMSVQIAPLPTLAALPTLAPLPAIPAPPPPPPPLPVSSGGGGGNNNSGGS